MRNISKQEVIVAKCSFVNIVVIRCIPCLSQNIFRLLRARIVVYNVYQKMVNCYLWIRARFHHRSFKIDAFSSGVMTKVKIYKKRLYPFKRLTPNFFKMILDKL